MQGLAINPAQSGALHLYLPAKAVFGRNFCNQLLTKFDSVPFADIAAAEDLHMLDCKQVLCPAEAWVSVSYCCCLVQMVYS
jgi:hypothetical protein